MATKIAEVFPPATGTTASFTDSPVGGSRYYVIVAVNIAGQRSAPSKRTGYFTFSMVPGSAQ